MTKNKLTTMLLSCSLLLLCACGGAGGDDGTSPTPTPTPTPTAKVPIRITTSITSRATDYGFEAGDKVGIYVVNRSTEGAQQALLASGNHVNNMCYTYNATWTPDQQTYWSDNSTHADFYLYYPYTASISDVEAYTVNVPADQSTEAAYKQGDFLVGSTLNVAPTESAVTINAKHVMSQMQVILAAGNGFTAETLTAANPTVKINNIKTSSTVSLSTGKPTATGSATSITPLLTDGVYKAIIVPQAVEECNLITVTVDGRDYNLPKAFSFERGKTHKFTVTISKTSNGVNVNITGWETDETDHGGVAE